MTGSNSSPSSASSRKKFDSPAKRVTDPLTVQKFTQTSNNISGTATNLVNNLKEIEQDLKKDIEGRKEFEDYLKNLEIKKADLQKRVAQNQAWIANFESNQDNGAFEAQYKKLLAEMQQIYVGAKEFHSKGIDMLIKEFDYHLAYKRWNDSFTAVPFKPK
mmetsp:Transcript_31206/g.69401  ORF Transcript_31206/g.69401 Transcript_31206/m.69401 type:complete len:160 (-) Transcript_31206:513-992(-)